MGRASCNEGGDMGGTKKAMLVNKPDDLTVTLSQLYGRNRGRAFEAGKAWRFHLSTLPRHRLAKKGAGLTIMGKCERSIPTLAYNFNLLY